MYSDHSEITILLIKRKHYINLQLNSLGITALIIITYKAVYCSPVIVKYKLKYKFNSYKFISKKILYEFSTNFLTF